MRCVSELSLNRTSDADGMGGRESGGMTSNGEPKRPAMGEWLQLFKLIEIQQDPKASVAERWARPGVCHPDAWTALRTVAVVAEERLVGMCPPWMIPKRPTIEFQSEDID